MRFFKMLSNLLILLLIPSLVVYPQAGVSAIPIPMQRTAIDMEGILTRVQTGQLYSYNDILNLIEELENGDLDQRCGPDELETINQFIISLARQGLLPSAVEKASILENDIAELLHSNLTPYEYAYASCQEGDYALIPALFYGQKGEIILCGGWFKKKLKQIKKFIKEHKEEIIIGAAIVVAAVVIVATIVAAPAIAAAAAGAGATGAAAASDDDKHATKHKESEPAAPSSVLADDLPFLEELLQEEIYACKECIDEEQFLLTDDGDFSLEENLRALGQAFAHQSLDALAQMADLGAVGYGMVDRAFSPDDTYGAIRDLGGDFREKAYQLRGERALELYSYDQAISDLDRVIELNPNNHEAYLNRATAHFALGAYDCSLKDYQHYAATKPDTLEYAARFAYSFVKALPQGSAESVKEHGSFASDLVCHPIDTAEQVGKAFISLSKLAYSQEWGAIAQSLAPEVCELVQNWDFMTPEEQGGGAGFVVSKHGTDFLIPVAAFKTVSVGVAAAEEVATACKALKTAEKILPLETLSQTGKSLYIGTTGVSSDMIGGVIANIDKLAEAGKVLDRGGLTVAGRGLAKHGNREGSIHPKPFGSPAQINEQGQKVLESILNHPEKQIVIKNNKQYGSIMDITVPNLGGVRFTADGQRMIGFLEP
jgi:tetratricopeptide (TPR) repeat protein